VVVEFVDFASGQRNGRPEYRRMFDAARKRRFDVLLVWRYDRFARSMQELVNALEEFRSLGIDFISYRENADTTTAQGKLIFGIMASLAEFERALIAERVKAGMARAKRKASTSGGRGSRRRRKPQSAATSWLVAACAARSRRMASAPRPCSGSRPSWPRALAATVSVVAA
jgi:DNA invertase Pin-like site-specific DNA recombinase